MNKYEIESTDSPMAKRQVCCQDALYLDKNTLVCLFEHNLLQVFKFVPQSNEGNTSSQIHSMVLLGAENVPDSASICLLEEHKSILLASHYGKSEIVDLLSLKTLKTNCSLTEWRSNESTLLQSRGPITDYVNLITSDNTEASTLLAQGMGKDSSLILQRKGLNIESILHRG